MCSLTMYSFGVLLCFLKILVLISADDKTPLCSEAFCEEYRDKNVCPKANAACQVQNETYQGEVFPAMVPCGCCQTCIEFLKEGEYCTIGSSDSAPPQTMCGPGLTCKKEIGVEDQSVCKKMDNACFKQQREFDLRNERNQTWLYEVRPVCDGDGKFGPVQCSVNQTCFCVNNDGQRIFGEMIYSENIERTMRCECSRLAERFNVFMESDRSSLTARCLEDGSFDQLQCMKDQCLCVEGNSGAPTKNLYNSTEISLDRMKCFNMSLHRNYSYLHDCETLKWITLREVYDAAQKGFYIMNYKAIECQPDGWYLPVQENSTSKYCVDKYGDIMADFIVPKNSQSLAANMNCKCARTRDLLRRAKVQDLPTCVSNGNFAKMQCRNDKCYCVDENGLQAGREVDMANKRTLNCGT